MNLARTRSGLARRLWATALGSAAFAMAAPGGAQVPPVFAGKWKATWQTEQRQYEAAVTVTEAGGTWQTATRDRNNPCAGREVPMKVEAAKADEVQLLLQFSEVIPGCTNVKVTLKTGPDGAVVGTRSKYELKLSRQP
jgi:hypothetical protein